MEREMSGNLCSLNQQQTTSGLCLQLQPKMRKGKHKLFGKSEWILHICKSRKKNRKCKRFAAPGISS